MAITGTTQLIGLIGWPVTQSKSPTMHNAAIAELQMDWAYVAMPVLPEDLSAAVKGLAALGFRGVNITVPHKQAIMRCIDEVDPAAQAVGAVNTLIFKRTAGMYSARIIGYNTDWSGFLSDIKSKGISLKGRGCFILGSGGSARAVAYALASAGGRVHLFGRRQERAKVVAHDIGPLFPHEHVSYHHISELAQIAPQWPHPFVVNTTPLGMVPDTSSTIWPAAIPFPAEAIAYDLVYNPAETTFMRQALSAGGQAYNGLGMLLYQGAQAFKLWTGLEPNLAVMESALLKK